MMIFGEAPVVEQEKYIIPDLVDLTKDYKKTMKSEHEIDFDGRFYAAKYPVTHNEWGLFCADNEQALPDDNGFGRGKLPVANIRDIDIINYVNWLNSVAKVGDVEPEHKHADLTFADYNESLGLPRDVYKIIEDRVYETDPNTKGFRIPLVRDWEFMKGDAEEQEKEFGITKVGWILENSGGKPQIPGQLMPNCHGLYDILGNLLEICVDYGE